MCFPPTTPSPIGCLSGESFLLLTLNSFPPTSNLQLESHITTVYNQHTFTSPMVSNSWYLSYYFSTNTFRISPSSQRYTCSNSWLFKSILQCCSRVWFHQLLTCHSDLPPYFSNLLAHINNYKPFSINAIALSLSILRSFYL